MLPHLVHCVSKKLPTMSCSFLRQILGPNRFSNFFFTGTLWTISNKAVTQHTLIASLRYLGKTNDNMQQ